MGFCVYINSLKGEFIWDDGHLIRDNAYIKNWSHITKIFTRDITAGSGRESSFYRPIQMVTYTFDYSLWKLNVKGYHLTNIFLHILAALTIFAIVSILYDDRFLSFLVSLFFVVHPVHTEAVAYISGRADPLAALFVLFSFTIYLKMVHLENQNKGLALLMVVSYIFALLSKESSLIFPALLLLYHYAFKKNLNLKYFFSILGITLVYILLRVTLLSRLLPVLTCPNTLFQRIPGFFYAISNYIRLIFLPFNLHMEYGNELFHFFSPGVIAGILITILLLVYGIRQRKIEGGVCFAVLWFFLFILPISNLYPINAYMAEHWLYLPSIGIFLFFARGIANVIRSKKFRVVAVMLTIGLLSGYAYLTVRQNSYWNNGLLLYERTLKYVSDSPAVYNNLGIIYGDMGDFDKAKSLFNKAIQIDKDYALAYHNLGKVYCSLGEREKAIVFYKKAIALNPKYAMAYSNLANIYKEMKLYAEAIPLYEKAIGIYPDFVEVYYNLANIYYGLGLYIKAKDYAYKLIEIAPGYVYVYNSLGNIYNALGDTKQAVESYKKAIELQPDFADAYNNLGVVYVSAGHTEKAIASFNKALEADIHYASAYNNLSIIYYNNKQYRLAVEYCDSAIKFGFSPADEFLEALKPFRE